MENLTRLGTISGYLANPAGNSPWPAVLVIQEWWGLDKQTRSIADRFAALGYLAFAPDLYHGELAQLNEAAKAEELVERYGPGAPAELQMVFDTLKELPDCSGRIGSVGFCFGGRMSLALALLRPLDAVCTFYGGGMQRLFDQLDKLASPVLGLFGDSDRSIPVDSVAQFDHLLDQLGVEHEIVIYPDAGHAFFRDSDPDVFRPEAAKDAWDRATKFFAKHLL